MSMNKQPSSGTTRYGFLLTPNFTMLAFSCAVEPLRMANRKSGQTLYEWPVFTFDDKPVKASNGIVFHPDHSIQDATNVDALFVCCGIEVRNNWNKPLNAWLQNFAKTGSPLGSLCTGAYLLARAGLLNGYRCTIHWEHIASIREEFPLLIPSEALFEMDGDRYTSAGGSAPTDMMLHLIRQRHGEALAIAISEQFMWSRIRDRFDKQRVPLQVHLGTSQPKLIEAVTLMEANLEEPMKLDEIAMHVGVSRRQLERLFQKYVHCVPTRYYLELRLNRARQLLLQTKKSIVDIALACGFISASHFSKCYRDVFGVPPSEERRLSRHRDPADGSDAFTPG